MKRGGQQPGATRGALRWPRLRRGVVVGAAGVAVGVAIGVVAWWLHEPLREGVRLHAQAQAFPWSRAPGTTATVEEASSQAAAVPAAPTASASAAGSGPARGPAAFDLCGLGRIVTPRADDRGMGPLPELPAPVGRHAFDEALSRIATTLAAGDARQRVAARLLQQPADDDPGAQTAWAQGLVADALASRDAQALRWAATACPFVEQEPSCRHRLARARVQAEPANALHWLDWAYEEPAAADAAWAGLQRASYWREQPLGLAAVTMHAVSADVPGYLQASLAVDAMARDVAFPAPPLSIALERCPGMRRDTRSDTARGSAMNAAGSAAPCERLARLLLERSDSVQALALGRELGEHIGWPAEQLQRLDREVETLQKQDHSWAIDEKKPLGCETVEAQRSHIAAVEREGELAVLRRNLAASQPPR